MKNKTIEQIIKQCIKKKIRFDIIIQSDIDKCHKMVYQPALDGNIRIYKDGNKTILTSRIYLDVPVLEISSIKC